MRVNRNLNWGFTAIEVLSSLALLSILLVSFSGFLGNLLNYHFRLENRYKAEIMADNAFEAIRSFRNGTDWHTDGLGFLDEGESYKIKVEEGQWVLEKGVKGDDSMSKEILIETAYRDEEGMLSKEGNYPDENTKRVTVLISTRFSDFEYNNYFTNWR